MDDRIQQKLIKRTELKPISMDKTIFKVSRLDCYAIFSVFSGTVIFLTAYLHFLKSSFKNNGLPIYRRILFCCREHL
jgi:hypothetical protein